MAGKSKVKSRLDDLLVALGLCSNLEQAQRLIGTGRVLVDGHVCDKVGSLIAPHCAVQVKEGKRFVSRGGEKLAAGLHGLQVNPSAMVCADIGCSTGGFTDCLLQHGAARVYSVDVGYGLLDWKLRQDPRVVVLERTNARFLTTEHIPEHLDLAVIDASFISLELLLPPLLPLFGNRICIIALVKPQFQLPRESVGSGGIVQADGLHQQAVNMVRDFAAGLDLVCSGMMPSPLLGAKGNREFLLLLTSQS